MVPFLLVYRNAIKAVECFYRAHELWMLELVHSLISINFIYLSYEYVYVNDVSYQESF